MMKKIVAGVLALVMLLSATGCTQSTQDPVVGALTFDELTDAFGLATQQQETATDGLSLPVSFKLTNSNELIDFMVAVTEHRAITYHNTLKEYTVGGKLETVDYTLNYDGMSAYVTRESESGTMGPVPVVQFRTVLLANACKDQAGNFDLLLFEQMMHSLNMDYWYKYYPYHMFYCVNAVVAVTMDGQYVVFDYYFDSNTAAMLGGASAVQ